MGIAGVSITNIKFISKLYRKLASDTGLNINQFEQDLDQIRVDDSGERDKLPITAMTLTVIRLSVVAACIDVSS